MNEDKLLRSVLPGEVLIKRSDDGIELKSEDGKQYKFIHIPKSILPKVADWFKHPRMVTVEEWEEIGDYVVEVAFAMTEIDLKSSLPKERELKIASFQKMLAEMKRKYNL